MTKVNFKISVIALVIGLLMVSCGGGNSNKTKDGKIDAEKVAEKLIKEEFTGETRSKAAVEHYLNKLAGIDLTTILPDYDYNCEPEGHCFLGEERNVVAAFFKPEGEVTKEELKAFVAKVYEATKKASDDGKNIYGFEKKSDKDEAMAELTLDDLMAAGEKGFIYLGMYDWGYRYKGKMLHVYTNNDKTNGDVTRYYVSVNIAPGLEKSFDETMKDAEKALEDPKVQEAIKDYLK